MNLDGKTDIIWRNTATGDNVVWYIKPETMSIPFGPGYTINSLTFDGWAYLLTVADSAWTMVGRADFDGDGKTDILWRNTDSGLNVVWYMDGANFKGWAYLLTVTDQDWTIVGTDDFDRDGKPDILWRNTDSGQNVVWYMDGANFKGWAYLPTVTDPEWKIVGSGDFNGDGKPDILWKNTSLGMTIAVVWYMNGATLADWTYYNNGYYLSYVKEPAWNLVGTGDFDGDGYPDTLWRNTSTGANRVVHSNSPSMYGGFIWWSDVLQSPHRRRSGLDHCVTIER